jgi:tetratricopeptide (TPR) repeat protein
MSFRHALGVLLICWLCLLLCLNPVIGADTYEKAIQQAMTKLYALDYDRAAMEFEQAISLQPGNPRAYLYLASCYWMKILYLQNKFLSTLFGMPQDVYAAPPNDSYPPELRTHFEDAIRRMKEKGEAIIQADPKNAEGYFWLGMAEGSEGVFTIAIDKKLLAAKAHADKSFDLMERSVKLDNTFKDPFFSMGMHMHLLGTRGFFTRMVLKMMGYKVSKEEGRRYVELAADEGRYVRDDARLGLILCEVREGDWKGATSTMRIVLARFPQNSLLAVAMGRLQVGTSDFAGAAATYRQVLQRLEQRHPGYQILSRGEMELRLTLALLASGQRRDALAEAEKAVKDPAASLVVRAAANLTLGQARDLLQNRQGAIAAYQAVLGLEPATPSHEKARRYLDHPYDGKDPAG